MNRVAACAFVLICASLLACASVSPAPFIPLPAGCNQGTDGTNTLLVDDAAAVALECVGFSRGKSKIVWKASANARYLLVAFKDKAANGHTKNPPADPSCFGTTCELAKSKTQNVTPNEAHEVGYRYSVVVVLKSGKVVSVDPRLIIQP